MVYLHIQVSNLRSGLFKDSTIEGQIRSIEDGRNTINGVGGSPCNAHPQTPDLEERVLDQKRTPLITL